MRLRVLSWLFVVLCSVLLISCFGVSINASAALTGGRYMTPSEALDVFGSEIAFTYFDGTDYTQSSFLYNTTVSMGTTSGALPDNWSDYTAATYLEYVATVQSPVPVANPNYITVNILPTYSIFDTEQITSLIALSSITSSVSTVYQSPSWDWVIGGTTYHYENDLDDGNGLYSSIQFRQHFQSTFVPMQFLGSVSTSGYSYRAQFSGNVVGGSSVAGAYRYKYYLHLMCPYISSDSYGSSGTFTQTSGTSVSGDINVDIDMSETNSLLESIRDGLSGIWSGIIGVFEPSEAFVKTWRLQMSDTLGNTFGKYTELDTTLTRVQTALTGTSGSAVVSFPGVSPPGIGQIIPASQVSAVPESLQSFLPHIKFAFNILATMLFVNGMKRKFDEIIHGKVVTETESGVL